MRGPSLNVIIWRLRRQIMTFKDGPYPEKNGRRPIKIGIQIKRKEQPLTKKFTMILN